jgi:KaiC/GvpD/RAD55 family RecA-like ATPase
MIKCVSLPLELRVIRTIASTRSQKEASKLFASLGVDCFATKSGKVCFARINTMLKERGELISWGELTTDPIIPEVVRERLVNFKEKAIPPESVDKAIRVLHKYRRMRSMLEMSQYIAREFTTKKTLDIEQLENKVSAKLVESKSKTGTNSDNWFIHVGAKDRSDVKAVKKMLEYDPDRVIPTGIKAYDDKALGIPRTSLLLIGGSTGAGKSIVIGQLAHNMARAGARVAIVPLEMKNEQMLRREISRLTETDMSRLNDPRTLTKFEKGNILSRYEKFREKLVRVGATLSLFSPDEDLTAEEILMMLKPFGFDVIFIDYIGLLKGIDGDDQWKAMRNVTRFCKRYAAINDMIIAVAAQLNEEGLIRYAKGMVEDASNAFFFTANATTRETGIMWIDQPKARENLSFRFPVKIDYKTMTVKDLSDEERSEIDEKAEKRKDKKGNKKLKFGQVKPSKNKDDKFDFNSDE